jgi:hypothetical protein
MMILPQISQGFGRRVSLLMGALFGRSANKATPFAGVCTTGLVARRHGRDFIGIDVNAAYLEMGRRRIEGREPIDDPPEVNGARDLFDWADAGGGACA